MGTYRYNPSTDELELISGGTLYADMAVGSIIPSGRASDNPAAGYLYCDGSALSRTEYAELFSAIGTAFGSGNGSTTFNIPDFRGKFAEGNPSGGTLGESKSAGLPNIKGSYNATGLIESTEITASGAFKDVTGGTRYKASIQSGNTTVHCIGFDASQSDSIYSDSVSTVQPPAVTVNFFIKAKQVAVPADFASAIDEVVEEAIAVSSVNISSSKSEKVGTVHKATVYKSGNTKTLVLNFNLSSALVNGDVIFTIPDNYKPQYGMPTPLFATASIAGVLWIGTDGTIKSQGAVSAQNYLTATLTYI